MIAVKAFHIVFRSAIGRYALGTSYLGLPGLRNTTVVKVFQGPYCRLRSSMAPKIGSSLSISRSAHLVSTMLGIPSGPGALYGLSLFKWRKICSFVIFLGRSHCRGYLSSACALGCCGFGGKKHFAKAALLSPLFEATLSSPPTLCFSAGMRDLPPSAGGAEISLCTAHMSGSSAFSSQLRQCCFFVLLSVFSYSLTASLCSLCITCMGSALRLNELLPFLFAALRNCVSSLVHHLFDLEHNLATGTLSLIVRWMISVSSLQFSSICCWFSIGVGCPRLCRCEFRVSLNSSQSTSQKFWSIISSAWAAPRLSSVIIGRWSVLIPLRSGCMSQVISKSEE